MACSSSSYKSLLNVIGLSDPAWHLIQNSISFLQPLSIPLVGLNFLQNTYQTLKCVAVLSLYMFVFCHVHNHIISEAAVWIPSIQHSAWHVILPGNICWISSKWQLFPLQYSSNITFLLCVSFGLALWPHLLIWNLKALGQSVGVVHYNCNRNICRNSLVSQWLGLCVLLPRAWIRSLLVELGSRKLCSMVLPASAKKISGECACDDLELINDQLSSTWVKVNTSNDPNSHWKEICTFCKLIRKY